MSRTNKMWTKYEDNYLRNNFKLSSIEVMGEYLGRSRSSIQNRLYKLGLKKEIWTADEERIILENYRLVTYRELADKYLFGKTFFQVSNKIASMGLNRDRWSSEEDEILRKYYKIKTFKEISTYLKDRSSGAVKERLHRLGLRKYIPWSENEYKILREYCGKIALKNIKEKYFEHRSIESIREKARSLGISCRVKNEKK